MREISVKLKYLLEISPVFHVSKSLSTKAKLEKSRFPYISYSILENEIFCGFSTSNGDSFKAIDCGLSM